MKGLVYGSSLSWLGSTAQRYSYHLNSRNPLFTVELLRRNTLITSQRLVVRWSSSNSPDNDSKKQGKKPRAGSTKKVDGTEKVGKERNKLSGPHKPGTSLVRRRQGQVNFNNDTKESETDFSESADVKGIRLLGKSITSIAKTEIPKPNKVLILPTFGRPLFPGFIQSHLISDRAVFEELKRMQSEGKSHAGLFFRHVDEPKSTSESISESISEGNSNNISESTSERTPNFNASLSRVGTFVEVLRIAPVLPQLQPDGESSENTAILSTLKLGNTVEEALELASEWTVILKGHRRIERLELLGDTQPLYAKINYLKEPPVSHHDSEEINAYENEILVNSYDMFRTSTVKKDEMKSFLQRYNGTDPYSLVDFVATLTSANGNDLQQVLEQLNLKNRVEQVLLLLKKQQNLLQLQAEMKQKIENVSIQLTRTFFLHQQLKLINEELGIKKDNKEVSLKKFRERLAELESAAEKSNIQFPTEAKEAIAEAIDKLQMLENDPIEFNLTRKYLEWLVAVPWTKFTSENYDLSYATNILHRDHHGLEDIKERIQEYVAVGNLKSQIDGKILLLVGPPGVGKTSIGKSIASALGRKFFRFSVGGLEDVNEIKGHRRTYIGAMPGKIIECLKQNDTMNPVILIDEIDKLSKGYRGDPASALLELLDPSQNTSFLDHYINIPVDLSKVLFICTANVTSTIPGPLLDRMEVLRLSGYDLPEKVNIARDYLIPRAKESCGFVLKQSEAGDPGQIAEPVLNPKVKIDVSLSQGTLEALARSYCREAGVRGLQQHIEKIFRKISFLLVKQENPDIKSLQTKPREEIKLPESGEYVIQEQDLESLLGQPGFPNDRMYGDVLPVGVVMGLAWTNFGGSSLYIETTTIQSSGVERKSKDNLTITGKLGEVMKESSTLAFLNAQYFLKELEPDNDFFRKNHIHLHIPEGATPKDGPSAGVTMTTAMLSLALGKAVSPDISMTGEISLTGVVLAVGGIKEKTIAARGANVKHIILPEANKKDVEDLPVYLKEGIQISFAKNYSDILNLVFPELSSKA